MDDWIRNHDVIIDPTNKRIRILNPQSNELNAMFMNHLHLAETETGFTKTIVYAKKQDVDFFLQQGFRQEAKIDGYFNGQNVYLLSKFLSEDRGINKFEKEEDEIVQLANGKNSQAVRRPLPEGMILRQGALDDAEQMAALLRVVFKTYPTPVHEPDYLKKVMQEDTYFMVIEHEGRIIGLASAEMVPELNNVEISDAATHPDYRGQGLLSHLFFALEDEMKKRKIPYLYTLARSQSAAMNVTVSRHGFQYTGRMVNNCDIFSGFENMNVWVKPLHSTKD
ncbi:putative beta-lysine N-acetyltransferase [Ammoniphilus oxalaticus]|uniref:Putative beta-lysine N-acetyltransferase n=1 Tax=Ammoniphilus oxalaticus TaxID=66863 RepID=A0A419SJ63_9BACL|nr:putative beta-lysine N-acetyltransferase [Ammoniphilus oxalaticus]RKD24025.1 putative beta-lysine N-acetyltransferase [Ammoniphilus oxalaticus]